VQYSNSCLLVGEALQALANTWALAFKFEAPKVHIEAFHYSRSSRSFEFSSSSFWQQKKRPGG